MNVLVLCTGNRWRSPLIAHLLRQERPEWVVTSRGTHCSHPGSEIPKRWRALVPGWTEPHSATRVSDVDLTAADVVVGVQLSHIDIVRMTWPNKPCILLKTQDPAFTIVDNWSCLVDGIRNDIPWLLENIENVQLNS